MKRDPGDIIDRLSIAALKHENLQKPESFAEMAMFMEGYRELLTEYPMVDWYCHYRALRHINEAIWSHEAALRKGALDDDPTEAGRRAILIRHWNAKRVEMKNKINHITGQGVQDVKVDHLSSQ